MRWAVWLVVAGTIGLPPARAVAKDRLTSRTSIAAARAWAQQRQGGISFAVVTEAGRLRGLRVARTYPSASVVKAMLLVATLRRARGRPLARAERRLLTPMIRRSSNRAAREVFARLRGVAALQRVARTTRMRHFAPSPFPFEQGIAAGDQARFFARIDRLVPRGHRTYARRLLRSVVSRQRWGIPPAAARHRLTPFFKGGWRPGVVHQVALLERDGRRMALAVLTTSPSKAYGERTIEGIAARVLDVR